MSEWNHGSSVHFDSRAADQMTSITYACQVCNLLSASVKATIHSDSSTARHVQTRTATSIGDTIMNASCLIVGPCRIIAPVIARHEANQSQASNKARQLETMRRIDSHNSSKQSTK
eukprot:scaffold236687_cov37-Prasinocladus_malaysianus.AAC.1